MLVWRGVYHYCLCIPGSFNRGLSCHSSQQASSYHSCAKTEMHNPPYSACRGGSVALATSEDNFHTMRCKVREPERYKSICSSHTSLQVHLDRYTYTGRLWTWTAKCFPCALQPSDKLEDGTVSFLDIISLRHGFDFLSKLGGVQK
jgi:hypothetical protein